MLADDHADEDGEVVIGKTEALCGARCDARRNVEGDAAGAMPVP